MINELGGKIVRAPGNVPHHLSLSHFRVAFEMQKKDEANSLVLDQVLTLIFFFDLVFFSRFHLLEEAKLRKEVVV